MSSGEVLKQMLDKYGNNEEIRKDIAAMEKTFQFTPTDGEPYFVKVSQGEVSFHSGLDEKPTATISGKEETLLSLFNGTIDPVMSYMTGKIKISGDLMSATKITGIVKKLRK
ncbi:MAG: SCP2 sterol-binding domain-containing protein [Cuniculiplasma sp.]